MARTALKSTLVVVLLLSSLQLAYWLGVRRYFDSLAQAVAPVARLSHERVVAFPPGRFGLDRPSFGVNGRQELTLSADHLRIQGIEPAWLVRWLAGFDTTMPDRLTLRLDGVRASAALLRALRTRIGGAGFMVPFEGFGCHEASSLSESDYDAIGWASPQLDVPVQLRRDRARQRLSVEARVDRAPAGVLVLSALFAGVPEAGIPPRADLGGARLQRLVLDYDEQGALARRNDYCSTRMADHNGNFDAEHLRRLHDWLGGHGLVPDEPIWAAYRAWLAKGGPIHLELAPAQAVAFAAYPEFAPPDRLRLLGIRARLGDGDPVRVEATAVRRSEQAFRPLPALEVIDQAQIPELRMLHAGIPVDDAFVGIDAPDDPLPESTPAGVPAGPAPPPVPVPVPAFTAIEFPELPIHLGRWVRISTVNGNRYRGLVLDATADAVELEIRRYGGGARLPISREQINRIDLVSSAAFGPG